MSSRLRFSLIFLCCSCLSVLFLWESSPAREGLRGDREVYSYLGWAVAHGHRLYGDVFDHKPPGFVWYLAIFPGSGPWWDWLAMVCATAFTLVGQWLLLSERGIRWNAVLTLGYLTLQTHSSILEGGGLTRQLASNIAFALICAVLSRSFRLEVRSALVGILSAMLVAVQPESALTILPFLVLLVFSHPIQPRLVLRTATYAASTGVLTLTLIGLVLRAQGVWPQFVDQVIYFNTQVYIPKAPMLERYLGAWRELPLSAVEMGLLLFALTGALMATQRDRWLLGTALLSLVLGMSAVALSGRAYGHYYLQVVPPCSFLLALGYSGWAALFSKRRFSTLLAQNGALTLLVAVLAIAAPPSRIWCAGTLCDAGKPARIERLPRKVARLAQKLQGTPGSIFVLQAVEMLWVHRRYNVLSPSPFVYFFPFIQFGTEIPRIGGFQRVVDAVQRRLPELVIDCSSTRELPTEAQQLWNTLREREYRPFHHEGICTYYQRSSSEAWDRSPTAPPRT